jgi:nucleotide-binding universal stress UspA family protein
LCCPVDFSAASRTALQHAAYLASANGELTLVHVRHAPSVSGDREQELDSTLAAWARDGVEANREVASMVLMGHPGDEILRLAREGHFNVFVLGTRGLIALGSAVEQVMQLTSCPVVVIREA